MKVEEEYNRIRKLFDGCDVAQLELVDGAIWECARLRVELDSMNEIIVQSGLIKVHPDRPGLQKELPVAKLIVRTRANYLNYIAKLSNILGRTVGDDGNDLDEFE